MLSDYWTYLRFSFHAQCIFENDKMDSVFDAFCPQYTFGRLCTCSASDSAQFAWKTPKRQMLEIERQLLNCNTNYF